METNKALALKNKIEELKDEFKQYKESTEDSVEKRRKLTRMQVEIGRYVKQLVLALKEEGNTTSVIAKRLGLSESRVRKLEG
jgi:DNA-directed RNA polymerase specialized sigma subunit